MAIIPLSDLTAMTTGRDTKALTTSFVRSQTLLWSGYKMRRVSPGVVEVKGEPTTHRTRSGGTRIDPHGPYSVDTRARTCSCMGFASRGMCAHLPAAIEFHEALERGESPLVRRVEYSKQLIAIREVEGSRLVCREGRPLVFRSWEAAGIYWATNSEINQITELVELHSADLEELAATGKYTHLCLMVGETEQIIPLPEVDWAARGRKGEWERGGFVNRKDFD